MISKSKWFALVKLLAPIILTTVKPELAPIADKITDGIEEAEKMKDEGKLQDKLQHVQAIAKNAAETINTIKGKEVVDKTSLDETVKAAVTATINAINIVNKEAVKSE